ncbi:MAG: hypothetical protein H0U75_12995 [Legionella sp.]|nr:hypothetical protein [Legionella sp.]
MPTTNSALQYPTTLPGWLKAVTNMSLAIIVTRGLVILNGYGNAYILNQSNQGKDTNITAAAGALISIYNTMASSSLQAILNANSIKSIPKYFQRDYDEVRENLLRSAILGTLILTPVGEFLFLYSEELFQQVLHAPSIPAGIAAKFFQGYMAGLPFAMLVNAMQQSMVSVQKPWFMVPTTLTQALISNTIGFSWALDDTISAEESALRLGYANTIAVIAASIMGAVVLKLMPGNPVNFFNVTRKELLKGICELLKIGLPIFVSVLTETASMVGLADFISSSSENDPHARERNLAILQASSIYLGFTSVSLLGISQSCMALTRGMMATQNHVDQKLHQTYLIKRASNIAGLCFVGLIAGTVVIAYKPATRLLLSKVDVDEDLLKNTLYVYLLNNLLGQLIDSVRLVGNGSLLGHGDLRMPTAQNIFSMLLVGLSLGYLMGPTAAGIGLLGPVIARQIGITVGAVLGELRFCQIKNRIAAGLTATGNRIEQSSYNPRMFKINSQTALLAVTSDAEKTAEISPP